VNVHFTKAKGKDNYMVNMMLEGAELKNKEKKPNIIVDWKQGKPNKNNTKWNDNGRIKEGRTKLM